MNHERWASHLEERVGGLEREIIGLQKRLRLAHTKTAKQKRRAEMWRARALTYRARTRP